MKSSEHLNPIYPTQCRAFFEPYLEFRSKNLGIDIDNNTITAVDKDTDARLGMVTGFLREIEGVRKITIRLKLIFALIKREKQLVAERPYFAGMLFGDLISVKAMRALRSYLNHVSSSHPEYLREKEMLAAIKIELEDQIAGTEKHADERPEEAKTLPLMKEKLEETIKHIEALEDNAYFNTYFNEFIKLNNPQSNELKENCIDDFLKNVSEGERSLPYCDLLSPQQKKPHEKTVGFIEMQPIAKSSDPSQTGMFGELVLSRKRRRQALKKAAQDAEASAAKKFV